MRSRIWKSAAAIAIGIIPGISSHANPTGADIVHGTVTIEDLGKVLNVHQATQKGIINWQSFSIAADEIANFNQPAGGATLNRVTAANPSQLLGQLNSTGKLLLINPNGILVGAGARIDTAGFLASTLDVPDAEFLAGGDMRFRGTTTASVTNLGTINAREGDVFLLGDSVTNAGAITAPNGTAGLAAGEQILVMATGEEKVFVEVGSAGTVENADAASIRAAAVELKANGSSPESLAVSAGGIVEATGVENRGGRIFLTGGGGKTRVTGQLRAVPIGNDAGKISVKSEVVEIGEDAVLDVSGPDGGEILVEGGSLARIDGKLDATGTDGMGGQIVATAEQLVIGPDAVLDASGQSGGGEILAGGAYQGQSDERVVENARETTVESGALLQAESMLNGDAGRVIVWADNDTVFRGKASAAAQGATGDGGFIEISGKENLAFSGEIDATSFGGTRGNILFDPNNGRVDRSLGAGAGPNDGELIDRTVNTGDGGVSAVIPTTFVFSPTALVNALGSGAVTISVADDFLISGSSIPFDLPLGSDLTVNAGGQIDLGSATIRNYGGTFTFSAPGGVSGGRIDLSGGGTAERLPALPGTTTFGRDGGMLTLDTTNAMFDSVFLSGGYAGTNGDASLIGGDGGAGGILNVNPGTTLHVTGGLLMGGGDAASGDPPGTGGAAGKINIGGVPFDPSFGPPGTFTIGGFSDFDPGQNGIDLGVSSGPGPGPITPIPITNVFNPLFDPPTSDPSQVDLGGDGIVDIPDINSIFGPINNQGDFNGDGNVDARDWNGLRNGFGQRRYGSGNDISESTYSGPTVNPRAQQNRDEKILGEIWRRQKRADAITALLGRNAKIFGYYSDLMLALASRGTGLASDTYDQSIKDIKSELLGAFTEAGINLGLGAAGDVGEAAGNLRDSVNDGRTIQEVATSDDPLDAAYGALFPLYSFVNNFQNLSLSNVDITRAQEIDEARNRAIEAQRPLVEERNRLLHDIDGLSGQLSPEAFNRFNPQTDSGVQNLYQQFGR